MRALFVLDIGGNSYKKLRNNIRIQTANSAHQSRFDPEILLTKYRALIMKEKSTTCTSENRFQENTEILATLVHKPIGILRYCKTNKQKRV